MAGPVGVEVAGVLVGLDDERRSAAAAGRGRQAAGQSGRQQRADERGRVDARRGEDVDEPPGAVLLPCVPGDADSVRPDGRVGDHLLPRLDRDAGPPRRRELGMVRGDRGQRLRDREPIRRRAPA
jgi:hypothetical protein